MNVGYLPAVNYKDKLDILTEVFAFDHHFEQMGFILLPSDL